MKKANTRQGKNRSQRYEKKTTPRPVDYSKLVVIGAVIALMLLGGCASDPGGGQDDSITRYAALGSRV